MTNSPIQRENVLECIHYQRLKCGYCYESGLIYYKVTKQKVKYIRFNL
ncbi:MAG: hypothetical protein ACFFEY_12340 [Candidatus Thorarchaeota archaeon]